MIEENIQSFMFIPYNGNSNRRSWSLWKESYVSMPWILVPDKDTITAELTRNSRIFLAATYTGSAADAIATLET